LIEVGGTVGDIESAIFLEALRQFQFRVRHENFLLCFVSLVPTISGEQKTKPTQHGVKDLRSLGLSPTIIFCRSTEPLEEATKNKISDFCHVKPSHVLSVHDVTNVYQVPQLLMQQDLHHMVAQCLNLELQPADLGAWQVMAESIDSFENTVKIALIGKYTGLQDSYLSVIKSLKHAAIACSAKLDLHWVEATQLEKVDENGNDKTPSTEYIEAWKKVEEANGVIVPGGFGSR
jgi:CTP synthase